MSEEPKQVIGYGPDAPTPWRVAGEHEIVNLRLFSHEVDPPDVGGIVDANGCEVIGSSEFLHGHEFLPRIVACVNACDGLANPVADVASLRAVVCRLPPPRTGDVVANGPLPPSYEELLEQRDCLADALRSVVLAQRAMWRRSRRSARRLTMPMCNVMPLSPFRVCGIPQDPSSASSAESIRSSSTRSCRIRPRYCRAVRLVIYRGDSCGCAAAAGSDRRISGPGRAQCIPRAVGRGGGELHSLPQVSTVAVRRRGPCLCCVFARLVGGLGGGLHLNQK